ncbi:MAG TPA: hypothetical protein VF520_12475 [Thermoleophilaceae bacterium]|jgi:ComF family protein
MRRPLLAALATALGAVLAPPLCAACGGRAGAAEPLCGPCRRALRWLGPAVVRAAGVPVWAPVAYEGPARELVRALKFRGARGAARVMGAQIAANAPPGLLDANAPPGLLAATAPPDGRAAPRGETALVPVPLHPRRRRRRGFNQAALLAAAVSSASGLPVADVLERSGAATTQVGRGRADRLAGPPGELRARAGAAVPARAILVDDVVTTGGTLAACAAALRAAGAIGVAAVAYARTPGR